MEKKTFKFYTLGCKVNQYDSARLGELLKVFGYKMAEKEADLVIIGTCAVTGSAISKNRKMINKARKENPKARLILIGCWPKVYFEEARKAGADMVISDRKPEKIVEEIMNINPKEDIPKSVFHIPYSKKDKSRYFLKIQDGCEQFCSYCIIPYARGKLKSRPFKEVIREAKAAVADGYVEIILSGIHLGLYGINNACKQKEEKNVDLISLLKAMTRIKGLERIRLSSIDVNEVSRELMDMIARENKLCQHLHISLQSGCDRTLKDMRRPYTSSYFKKKMDELRERAPDMAISTDVIVGFPGENEDDFRTTYDFIKGAGFSRLHVFSFSARPGTKAWEMEPKVPKEEIKRRSSALRKLDAELRKKYRKKFEGRELEILIEAERDGKVKGKSEYFFDIWADKEDLLPPIEASCRLVGKKARIKYG